MIKGLKKFLILICFAIGIFTLVGFQVQIVQASDEETVLSEYVVRVGDLETRSLMGGVTLYKERVKSTKAGIHTGDYDPNSLNYEYDHNTIQWVELPKDNEGVRIVVWSDGDSESWSASTVRKTAKDYEKNNPGWIVVAAVNGDGFQINTTHEPNNIHVQEGEFYQPILGGQEIGFKDDNSPILYGATKSSKPRLEVLDENGNVIKYVEVASVNGAIADKGITVITKDTNNYYDLTGLKVYCGKYDVCRVSRNIPENIFLKGSITSISSDFGDDERPLHKRDEKIVQEFYLVSKDNSLDELINVGSYIRCQYFLTGEWEGINNAISAFGGYMLKDGVVQHLGSTDHHPRTVIGFKEDGSTVLMVSDGRGKQGDYEEGITFFQEGELMRLAGCVNALNLDGGGSSTLLVRNEYGDFEVINRPSDGVERSIGNAILLVMKDPSIEVVEDEMTRNSVTFQQNANVYTDEMSNIEVTVDGKTGTFIDGRCTIDGLLEDTTYVATISYDVIAYNNASYTTRTSFTMEFKTKPFEMPSVKFKIDELNKTSFTVVKETDEFSNWFENVKINIDGTVYDMGNKDRIKIENLFDDMEYELNITFTCVEPTTNNKYEGSTIVNIKTLSYYIPEILNFEVKTSNNRVTVDYQYNDPDSVVDSAYLYMNGEVYQTITQKKGSQTLRKLDLENQEYTFQLLVYYHSVYDILIELKSELITVGTLKTETYSSINYDLDGGINHQDNPETYLEGTTTLLSEPTKDGYKFIGWYLENVKINEISADTIGNITLVAKWEKIINTYTITYNLDGGVNNPNNPSSYEEGASISLLDPTKEGYVFLGWYEGNEKITSVKNRSVNLTAKWEKQEVKKGCKKSLNDMIAIFSLISLTVIILRKKH